MDLIVFFVEGHRYGLRLDAVQEVVRAVKLAHLPGAPAVVEGAMNYRGTVVPVLDVRSRFGHAPKRLEISDQLIVARAGGWLVAVRADEVGWPVQVESSAIEELTGSTAEAAYVAGVGRLADGLVVIHDLETFLSAVETAELAGALAPATSARTS
jgi:purine-binding chemotaxis protein CheW